MAAESKNKRFFTVWASLLCSFFDLNIQRKTTATFYHKVSRMSTKPYVHNKLLCQPYAVYQPYINHMSAIYQPYVSHISSSFQPYINYLSATYQANVNHMILIECAENSFFEITQLAVKYCKSSLSTRLIMWCKCICSKKFQTNKWEREKNLL